MQALRNSVNDVNNVKANSNYINEDNGPKEATIKPLLMLKH